MKNKKQRKMSLDELIAECEHEYATWKNIRQNGCRDPCWADGVNLNLVRNHIIYAKEKIKEYCEQEGVDTSPIFLLELPPQVAPNFMTNAESIKENAKLLLTKIEQMTEYAELMNIHCELSDEQRKTCGSARFFSQIQWLKQSVARNEFVEMRRFVWQEEYLIKSVSELLAKAKTIVPESRQLNLFDDVLLRDENMATA